MANVLTPPSCAREYNRQTSPVDPSTPSRTLNSSGTTVRLFEARTYGNAKVVLKEFLPKGLKLAYREIEVGWDVDVRRPSPCAVIPTYRSVSAGMSTRLV